MKLLPATAIRQSKIKEPCITFEFHFPDHNLIPDEGFVPVSDTYGIILWPKYTQSARNE